MHEPDDERLQLGVQNTFLHVKSVDEGSVKIRRSQSEGSVGSKPSLGSGSGKSGQVLLESEGIHKVFVSSSEPEESSGQESNRSHTSSKPANAPGHPQQQSQESDSE